MSEAPQEEEQVFVEDLGTSFDATPWIPEPLLPTWEFLNTYPLVGAIALVVVSFLLAYGMRGIVLVGLLRIASKSRNQFDDVVITNLKKPVFMTILNLGLILAVQVAKLPFGSSFLIHVFASAIIVSWMLNLLRLSSGLLDRLAVSPRASLVEPRTIPLFDLVFKLVVILVASYSLLLVWGINPLGWLASAGIVGIAIGFAAKDTLANLFSGLFILADSPYKIGDYINLDTGERGKITHIGMRSTRLLTRSDVEITVPNAVIANAKITNESGGPYQKMRIRLPVGVAYGSDVDQVCEVLQKVGDAHEETAGFPEPRVRMRGFGSSELNFELLAWIEDPQDRGRISHQLYIDIYKAFAEAGIEIPFSKQDVYIKEFPSREPEQN